MCGHANVSEIAYRALKLFTLSDAAGNYELLRLIRLFQLDGTARLRLDVLFSRRVCAQPKHTAAREPERASVAPSETGNADENSCKRRRQGEHPDEERQAKKPGPPPGDADANRVEAAGSLIFRYPLAAPQAARAFD